jgi:hypothetical protein
MAVRTWPARVLVLIAIAVSAPASAQRLQAAAEAYAKRNQLIAKKITLNVGGRKVTRVFVPVLAETAKDFASTFNADKGAVILRHSARDLVHVSLLFGWGDGYGYRHTGVYTPVRLPMELQTETERADGQFRYDHTHPSWSPSTKGRYLVMELEPPKIAHLRRFLDDGQGGAKPAHCQFGGCMWWLVHAPVDAQTPLAWAMGIKQSRTPAVLINKLVHAGNEHVSVVGVAVDNRAAFDGTPDATLLGAAPPMGAAEAAK